MKQEGRNEQELTESYCFLYPDKSKVLMMDVLQNIMLLLLFLHDSELCAFCVMSSSSGSARRVCRLDTRGLRH